MKTNEPSLKEQPVADSEELRNYAKIEFKFCEGLEYGYTICPFDDVASQLEAIRSNFEVYDPIDDDEFGKPLITITPIQLTDKQFDEEIESWNI